MVCVCGGGGGGILFYMARKNQINYDKPYSYSQPASYLASNVV